MIDAIRGFERQLRVNDLEKVRRSFRPRHITTLFVGESPPHSGTFFYKRDSRLYRRVKEAFGNGENFLSEFKAKGFFLDDLVLYPINQIKEKNERNEHRRKGVSVAREADERLSTGRSCGSDVGN